MFPSFTPHLILTFKISWWFTTCNCIAIKTLFSNKLEFIMGCALFFPSLKSFVKFIASSLPQRLSWSNIGVHSREKKAHLNSFSWFACPLTFEILSLNCLGAARWWFVVTHNRAAFDFNSTSWFTSMAQARLNWASKKRFNHPGWSNTAVPW